MACCTDFDSMIEEEIQAYHYDNRTEYDSNIQRIPSYRRSYCRFIIKGKYFHIEVSI